MSLCVFNTLIFREFSIKRLAFFLGGGVAWPWHAQALIHSRINEHTFWHLVAFLESSLL